MEKMWTATELICQQIHPLYNQANSIWWKRLKAPGKASKWTFNWDYSVKSAGYSFSMFTAFVNSLILKYNNSFLLMYLYFIVVQMWKCVWNRRGQYEPEKPVSLVYVVLYCLINIYCYAAHWQNCETVQEFNSLTEMSVLRELNTW